MVAELNLYQSCHTYTHHQTCTLRVPMQGLTCRDDPVLYTHQILCQNPVLPRRRMTSDNSPRCCAWYWRTALH